MSNHNKIINQVAIEMLKPYGLYQKGKSRVWIDDHIWFFILVEYQPSSFSKGTYLNIGIHFNWTLVDYFSFDYAVGNFQGDIRVSHYIKYRNDDQFTPEVIKMTQLALQKIDEYRKFKNIDYAYKKLKHYKKNVIWEYYHQIMISILMNKDKKINKLIDKMNTIQPDSDRFYELKQIASSMHHYNTHQEKVDYLIHIIIKSRELLKLPLLEQERIKSVIEHKKTAIL